MITWLETGQTYVNIHDAVFPGGEIRGQLQMVPEPASLAMGVLAAGGMVWVIRRQRGAVAH